MELGWTVREEESETERNKKNPREVKFGRGRKVQGRYFKGKDVFRSGEEKKLVGTRRVYKKRQKERQSS